MGSSLSDVFRDAYWESEIKRSRLTAKQYDDACKKTLTMDIPGLSANQVNVETKWVNRTKTLSLIITVDEEKETPYTEEYVVDTDIYNRYSWKVEDGRLTITLYEIINEKPDFQLI